MTIDRNDPRWTAYVLDEMDGPERAEFKREIGANPEAAEILDEIRKTVGLMESSLESAPVRLTGEQRDRVVDKASTMDGVRYRRWIPAAGVAALVLVGLATFMIPDLLLQEPRAGDEDRPLVALQQPPARPAEATLNGADRVQEGDSSAGRNAATGGSAAPAGASAEIGAAPRTAPAVDPGPVAIAGKVTDVQGALIPGAEVTLIPDGGPQRRMITNNGGEYRFDEVQSGRVELRATLPGFNESRELFEATQDTSRDLALEVGGFSSAAEIVSAQDRPLPTSGPPPGFAQSFVAGTRGGAAAAPPSRPGTPELRDGIGRAIGIIAENTIDDLADRIVDRRRVERANTEEYSRISDNPFYRVSDAPLATFSVDVDTASYANVRRFLTQRTLPPPDAVRIEEMLNYFTYDYAPPTDGRPVRVNAEVASAPWNPEHRLIRVGIQGQASDRAERGSSNLVFLIDVSGSMDSPDKLPLLKEGMKLLVEQLGENDRVAIVVYAGASGLVLPSTTGDRKRELLRALDRLSAGGSTNGGAGIELAYDTAIDNFITGGVNRVILATDGDFNVGVTNNGALTRLIEEKAQTGVFLSVLGFGTGNLNDAGLEALADRGNGNYAYIDSIREARKVLVDEVVATLVTIARDVKFQVEFNPAEVNAYRLIGYENRLLEDQDFNDDTKDAGEIGAGHRVTALFEVVPNGVEIDLPEVDPLRYQARTASTDQAVRGELLTVKVRYKEVDQDVSQLIETPLEDAGAAFDQASSDYRFAAAVAAFGMILRDSPYKGGVTLDSVLEIADDSRGDDPEGYRGEFVDLVKRARALRDLNGN